MIGVGDGPYEIRASGWRATFQRRVQDVGDAIRSPNRGALPCHVIGRRTEPLVAVPLVDGESLWVAVTCGRDAVVRGRLVNGDRLSVSVVSRLDPRSVLLSVGAVRQHGMSRPIDHRVAAVARSAGRRPEASLTVTVSARHRTEILRVALVTPRIYARLSGCPAPPRSLPDHAFAGWRLP